jgi:iron-sulfur cluster repair protein YtfE (RIC family)
MDTTFRNASQAHAAAQTTDTLHVPERYNIYLGIHKALRSFMCDTLCRIGRVDVDDADELAATLGQLDALLRLCAAHIEHENDFLHSAIEARQPAGSARTASDHREHFESIAMLRAQAGALGSAPAGARATATLRLYRQLALFVAENFAHMHVEETANATTLWAHYSDAELHAIHDRLLATLAPQDHLMVARWMVPALNPAERAGMFDAMKTTTPPEALLGVLAHVQPYLDASGWRRLARTVGVPPSPGPVNVT